MFQQLNKAHIPQKTNLIKSERLSLPKIRVNKNAIIAKVLFFLDNSGNIINKNVYGTKNRPTASESIKGNKIRKKNHDFLNQYFKIITNNDGLQNITEIKGREKVIRFEKPNL